MKTVYEVFLDFANSRLSERSEECRRNVAAGIKAFLTEIDVCNEIDSTGDIANRELIRFQLMPADTFAAFFEHYEVRSQITRFRKECELLAQNRLKNDSLISSEVKTRKLTEFYELVAELAKDNRYSSWIDDMAALVRTDLSFAAGQSNTISQDLADWFEMNS